MHLPMKLPCNCQCHQQKLFVIQLVVLHKVKTWNQNLCSWCCRRQTECFSIHNRQFHLSKHKCQVTSLLFWDTALHQLISIPDISKNTAFIFKNPDVLE